MALPMIRFPDGELAGWTGPWPPPAVMYRVQGRMTGGVSYTDDATLAEQGLTLAELRAVCDVTTLELVSASSLPASVDALEHVARCAEYRRADG